MAIEHALTVLSWHEHLPKDEVPPEHLWDDNEGLDEWWKRVEAKRVDGIPISRARGGTDEDPSAMAENDLARALKQG